MNSIEPKKSPARFIPLAIGVGGLIAMFLTLQFQFNWLRTLLILAYLAFAALMIFSARGALNYARITGLLLIAIVITIPFVWLVCSSFKRIVFDDHAFLPPPGSVVVVNNDEGVPESVPAIGTHNYKRLFEARETVQGKVTFWRYIWNSLFLASTGTFVSMAFCSMGGYALAKFKFAGRNALIVFMLASWTIPGLLLLAPNFEIIWHLGWMDSFKALIVPGCVSVFGIFLFRQAILGVPDELIEAGRIDGCSEFRIYLQLVMPLVRPMTSAFCLITFLGAWNAFLGPNIFLQSQGKLPLPVVLNQYLGVYAQEYGVFLAGTLLAIIPPAVLFLSLQREFISGLTSGAVKG